MTYTTEWEAGQCFEKKLSTEKAQIDCAQLQIKQRNGINNLVAHSIKFYYSWKCFHDAQNKPKHKQYCSKKIFYVGWMKMWKAKVIFDNL